MVDEILESNNLTLKSGESSVAVVPKAIAKLHELLGTEPPQWLASKFDEDCDPFVYSVELVDEKKA